MKTEKETVLTNYWFWSLLEVAHFFSQIWGIMIYVTCHALSPFTVYQYYLIKAIANDKLDCSKLWHDHKPVK